LFFELHDHSYCNDPAFTERWGEYIKELVVERLWNYAEAVFDKELGWEKFKIDGLEQTLSNALERFGREYDVEAPKLWWNGRWADLVKCEDCEEFGVSINDDGEMDCSPCGTMEFCADCHRNRYFFCVDCDCFRAREVQSKEEGPLGALCVDCYEQFQSGMTECFLCEDEYKTEDLISRPAGHICKTCLKDWTDPEAEAKPEPEAEAEKPKEDKECENCGEMVSELLEHDARGELWCSDCYEERIVCQECDFDLNEDDVFISADDQRMLCESCYEDDKADAEEEKRQYEERKKELEAKPRKTYKCRVECPADIDRTMKKMKLILNEGAHFITTKIHAEPMDFGSGPITLPDREWTFTAIQDLGTIRTIFRLVEDLHVGLQTLQLEEDYTGERDYDLE
jgi:hypothetical protein